MSVDLWVKLHYLAAVASKRLCGLCSLCLDLLTTVDGKKKPKKPQANENQSQAETNKQTKTTEETPQQFAGDFLQISTFWFLRNHIDFYRAFPWWELLIGYI